jgi:hypothetical protein
MQKDRFPHSDRIRVYSRNSRAKTAPLIFVSISLRAAASAKAGVHLWLVETQLQRKSENTKMS